LELLNNFQKYIFNQQIAAFLKVPPGDRAPGASPCYATGPHKP